VAAQRDVFVVEVASQATAVIALVSDWEAFAELWAPLLGEVWETLRAAGAATGRNVMLYKDDRPAVEVGVELLGEFAPSGRVTLSSLPGGRAATTTDPGPPTRDSLRAAHQAVGAFCAAGGHTRAGPLWEVYSHWSDVAAENHTEIYHLLA
jgi:hypothetical protein